MINEQELPDSIIERIKMMERILIDTATGGGGARADYIYVHLRREFMNDYQIRNLLPDFVRTYRSLEAFWPFIKNEAATYAERRQIISAAFTPLIDSLEGQNLAPADSVTFDALQLLDAEHVHAVWSKALSRRTDDPEGAITLARTLLETVIKRILDDFSLDYTDKDKLPKLYEKSAKALSLAPNQHSEEPIKAILGSVTNLVNGIGTLRNRLSDSHGKGGPLPVRPSPRHANLAVNAAGAVATFLVETHLEKLK